MNTTTHEPTRILHEEHEAFDWNEVPLDDGQQAYPLDEISADGTDDIFAGGEPDSFFVHRGSVKVAGPIRFGADEHRDVSVWVIDGDLEVDGALIVEQDGIWPAALYVTGTLTCTTCQLWHGGKLYVGKDLQVTDLLATCLSDMGTLAVKGVVKARHWVNPSERGMFELHHRAEAVRLVDAGRPHAPDDGDDDRRYGFSGGATRAADEVLADSVFVDGQIDVDALERALGAGEAVRR